MSARVFPLRLSHASILRSAAARSPGVAPFVNNAKICANRCAGVVFLGMDAPAMVPRRHGGTPVQDQLVSLRDSAWAVRFEVHYVTFLPGHRRKRRSSIFMRHGRARRRACAVLAGCCCAEEECRSLRSALGDPLPKTLIVTPSLVTTSTCPMAKPPCSAERMARVTSFCLNGLRPRRPIGLSIFDA